MKKAMILAGAAGLALLSSCSTLAPGSQARTQTVVAKPQLTEGQLQERFIERRNEGRRLLEGRRYGAAMDAFFEANEIRGNFPDILLGIGQAYAGLEYWDKAKTFFDRYLGLEKDRNPVIYRMIATIYGDRLENFEAAVKVYGKAIEASVAAPLAGDFYSRGLLLQRLGRKDEAVDDFRMVVDLAKAAKDDRLALLATNAMASLAGSK